MSAFRWTLRLGLAAGAATLAVLGPATAASAHPLGNATVNHYDGLRLYPDHVTDLAVEDIAEIPTLQRKPTIDTDSNGTLSDAERSAYAASQCAARARGTRLTVDGKPVRWTVGRSEYAEHAGAIRLTVGRLVCEFSAPVDLSRPAKVVLDASWDSAGVGWHEITATGSGVSLQNSPVPATSISDVLRSYPNQLLTSPLDQRNATLDVLPGTAVSTYAAVKQLPVAGQAVQVLNRISTMFNDTVGQRHLTLGVGLLALLLSMVLGAGHAFLPGHGKTIMAAYLVGRRGRLRDVLAVGATVTITHTGGVLILGLLISMTAAFAPTAAEQALGVVSGLIVAGVGVGLLISSLRRLRRRPDSAVSAAAPVDVPPDLALALVGASVNAPASDLPVGRAVGSPAQPGEDHLHGHADGHHHRHGHSHGLGQRHGHGASDTAPPGFGRGGLIGLGVAGGLVPSPSALLVLLAAVALGRTVFGVVLVLGYGLGMATALMATGLLLVKLRNRLVRLPVGQRLARLTVMVRVLPVLTAVLVLVVGAGLAVRAMGGTL